MTTALTGAQQADLLVLASRLEQSLAAARSRRKLSKRELPAE